MTDKHDKCKFNTRCLLPNNHEGPCQFNEEDTAKLAEFFKQLAEYDPDPGCEPGCILVAGRDGTHWRWLRPSER